MPLDRVGLGLGLVVALTATTDAFGGAWTAPAGTGQIIVTSTTSVADRVFSDSATAQPGPRFRKHELQALFEWGLSDWFTAVATPSLQTVEIGAPADVRGSGIGSSDLGGRFRVWHGENWVLSGQAIVRLPGTSDTADPAALGRTGVEVDLRSLFGANFALFNVPAFFDVQAAHRFRTGGPPNEFRADATIGLRPFSRWLFLAQSFNVVSEGVGAPGFAGYAYHRLQFGAVYALTPTLSLQLGGFVTYAGRNALQENALILGAWYKF